VINERLKTVDVSRGSSKVHGFLASGDNNSRTASAGERLIDGLSNSAALKLMGKTLKSGDIASYQNMREALLERVYGKIGQKIKHFDKKLSKMDHLPEYVDGQVGTLTLKEEVENGVNAANNIADIDLDIEADAVHSDSSDNKALIVGIEYDETGNPCPGAEHDANTWSDLLEDYDQEVLIDHQATKADILDFIEASADEMEAGDTFVFTYAGHGSQLKDTNGDELDGLDEQIHVWDNSISDDEIWHALDQFKEGVNVITVMDTCSSDTNMDIDQAGYDNANFVAFSGSPSDDYAYGSHSGGVMTNAFSDALTTSSYTNYFDLFEDVYSAVTGFGDGQKPTFETGGPGGNDLALLAPFGLA